jgi:hypothetical protein
MEDSKIIEEILNELTNIIVPLQDTIVPLQDTVIAASLQDTVIAASLQDTVVPLQDTQNPFAFISDPNKKNLLNQVNDLLHINKFPHNILIFIYSGPKVGSTSLVSSLRIFGPDKFSVIHIHDEEMLKILSNINGITVNEIILYNKHIGKKVYVIDVYRSPIERKISAFFEKIGSYHFNNTDENINKYNIQKVITRFNKILPYLANGDHFIDKYNINIPKNFDYINKYLLVQENGIEYIKLRLKDSAIWGNILTNILGYKIGIVKDYDSNNKPIKDLYVNFKSIYKIPKNLLNNIMSCKYINYYYSPSELNEYYLQWINKSTTDFVSYTEEQYKIYEELTLENSHIDYIQFNHYMDEGCSCKACNIKRSNIANKIMSGIPLTNNDQIKHEEAKTQLLTKCVSVANRINKINYAIKNMPQPQLKGRKNFKQDMSNIVNGKTRF